MTLNVKGRNFILHQDGFTLLEVVIAALILALAYVAVLQNFSFSLKNINKIEKTRDMLFDELISFSKEIKFVGINPLNEEKDVMKGDIFLEGENYRLVIVKSESGELVTLQVQPNL